MVWAAAQAVALSLTWTFNKPGLLGQARPGLDITPMDSLKGKGTRTTAAKQQHRSGFSHLKGGQYVCMA